MAGRGWGGAEKRGTTYSESVGSEVCFEVASQNDFPIGAADDEEGIAERATSHRVQVVHSVQEILQLATVALLINKVYLTAFLLASKYTQMAS